MRYLSGHFFWLLFLFISIGSCLGQSDNDHDPYFVETKAINSPYGPQSITRNILEDSEGNIWLATWEGIMSYDGKTFTNYTNKEGLNRFHAFCLLEDKAGNMWFGTIGAGVYHFDGESFTNYRTDDGFVNDRVGCIYEDKSGKIWFGTEGGISVYDGSSFSNFTTDDGLSNNDVNSIIEDKNGIIWIGTRGEACTYDGKTFTRFTNKEGKAFTNVRSIIEDKKGDIWLAGNDGLWSYDRSSFTNHSRIFTGYIYEDQKGNIWTSSESDSRGTWVISRYDVTYMHHEKMLATTIKQEEGMFFGIHEDRTGGIWFGSLNGICRYDGQDFNHFLDNGTQSDSLTDPRDGETYPILKIGDQVWMVENLRFNAPGSKINPDYPSEKYGRLYDGKTAQTVCPDGWHLPSDSEWNQLEMALGMSEDNADKTFWRGEHGESMKSVTGWSEEGNGTNSSEFNGLPAGYYSLNEWGNEKGFGGLGQSAGYWASVGSFKWSLEDSSDTRAWLRFLAGPHKGVNRFDDDLLSGFGVACRCVKN